MAAESSLLTALPWKTSAPVNIKTKETSKVRCILKTEEMVLLYSVAFSCVCVCVFKQNSIYQFERG